SSMCPNRREIPQQAGNDGERRPLGGGFGNLLDEGVEDVVGGGATGFGLEVEDHAVAQGGEGDGPDVAEGDVEAAFHEGKDFGAEHDRLGAAGADAVANVSLDLRRGAGALGVGRQDQADDEVADVASDLDLAGEVAHGDDGFAVGDALGGGA